MSALEPGQVGSGIAYIHAQGIVPNGLYIREDIVEDLIDDGVISQCDGCGSEDPDFPAYAIDGGDEEEEANLAIVLRYEMVVVR